jgi:hypothetical protein
MPYCLTCVMKAAELVLRELAKAVRSGPTFLDTNMQNMPWTCNQRYSPCRAVESQLQPVVEVLQPGPVTNAQRWNVEKRRQAEQAVQRALDAWSRKHGSPGGL